MYSPYHDTIKWKRWRVIWLFSGCVMVSVILVVGGLTRLNQAGLSMTEWEVISGVIPPMSESDWQNTFETYRQFPEYREVHRGMTLSEFKVIYWWEFSHRMLSRLLGVLFLIPFLLFVWKRVMPPDDALKLVGIALLGGVQAFLGWYMVQSGLESRPVVSHLRLGIHLVVAFLIFAFLWKMALNRIPERIREANFRIGKYRVTRRASRRILWLTVYQWVQVAAVTAIALLFIQVLVGGWTAGLKAGFVYPTFPKMGDYWIPPELGRMAPWWYDLSHNAISVQFLHRIIALLLTLVVVPPMITGLQSGVRSLQLTGLALLLIIALQITTGALNVLWGVPVWLSSVHQFGALLMLAALLTWKHYYVTSKQVV